MKTLKYLVGVLTVLFAFVACQKEMSLETGFSGGNAAGSLLSESGQCQAIEARGQFVRDSLLTDSNYVLVQVNFNQPGMYKIVTGTENGFSFSDSGYMINTGVQTLKLQAIGRPIDNITTNFLLMFDTSFCSFSVNVLDTPVRQATYTLQDSAGRCSSATVQGTYRVNTALNSTNQVGVRVNVSIPGQYNITSTATNGMTFRGTGIFTSTGVQTVNLRGTGTPTVRGANIIPITAGNSQCSFTINVDSASTNPVTATDYFPTTTNSNWTYTETNTGDTDRITVTPIDVTFGANTYDVFLASNATSGLDSMYYRKSSGFYYQYSNMDDFNLYQSVNGRTEFIFLRDNLGVNSTWESPEIDATFNMPPIPATNGKAKIVFTIVGKDITTTVGTQTVDSVIQVKRDYQFKPNSGTYSTIVSVNFYYGKGKGFLKAEATQPTPVTIYATRWQIY